MDVTLQIKGYRLLIGCEHMYVNKMCGILILTLITPIHLVMAVHNQEI